MKAKERIIFEDLKMFLKKNGISSTVGGHWIEVYFNMDNPNPRSAICFIFYIDECSIIYDIHLDPQIVVSLADPQYREKFLKHCIARHDNKYSLV